MKTNNFRYDINGLRAYAVILVILYHFGIPGFGAGFLGVDIFFVISGFLMTSIVVKSIENGNFSIIGFYLSRGIRIVPALISVSVVLLILGWFFLLPLDYRALAKHVFSSINFFSNIIYWKESGYFDTASHNKALLHTWSLSVEWQFYLIFPIIVTLLYKIKPSRNFLFLCMGVGAFISFVLSTIVAHTASSAGFYLLPTRAWELLIGGFIFFIPNEKISYKKGIEIFGFILIVVSCYLFSSSTIWPSYNALLPVLGTFCILLSNQQNSIFTRGIFFQWFGNTSYSIYLWHWPIVFFLYYFYKNDDYTYAVSGLFLSVILGWLSYKFIENVTRKKLSNLSKFKAYLSWISTVSIISLISIIIFKLDGIENRFPIRIQEIEQVKKDVNPTPCINERFNSIELKSCTYGSGPTSLIVIGDSHANAMLNGVIHALPKNTSLITFMIAGCPTIFNIKENNDNSCSLRLEKIYNELKNYQSDIPVLIINRINIAFKGLPEEDSGTVEPVRYIKKRYSTFSNEYYEDMKLAYISTIVDLSKDHPIYITEPTPEAPMEIPSLAARINYFGLSETNLKISLKDYKDRSKYALDSQTILRNTYGIHIIPLSKFFCDKNFCHFTKNGMPLFHDDDHMSWHASLLLTPIFKKEIFGQN